MSVNDGEKNFMTLEEERLLRLKEYAQHVLQSYQKFIPKISQVTYRRIWILSRFSCEFVARTEKKWCVIKIKYRIIEYSSTTIIIVSKYYLYYTGSRSIRKSKGNEN